MVILISKTWLSIKLGITSFIFQFSVGSLSIFVFQDALALKERLEDAQTGKVGKPIH